MSTHLIRMWQKRYDAVSPHRSDSNRRLYSEAEVDRLRLLRAAVDAGHRIGDIAKLPDEDLRGLVPAAADRVHAPAGIEPGITPDDAIARALDAALRMDVAAFQEAFLQASARLGFRRSLSRFVAPLAHRIGELWREGTMTAAHEHFATAAIRTFVLGHSRSFASSPGQPIIVVGTPAGQLHEIGAVLAAAAAGEVGWHVVYLGASLPATEIAGAVIQHRARALALSIVYPQDDPQLAEELRTLRRALPLDTRLIVGGRAADAYADVLREVDAVSVVDLPGLEAELDRLRSTPARRMTAT